MMSFWKKGAFTEAPFFVDGKLHKTYATQIVQKQQKTQNYKKVLEKFEIL